MASLEGSLHRVDRHVVPLIYTDNTVYTVSRSEGFASTGKMTPGRPRQPKGSFPSNPSLVMIQRKV
jgi:hypothetical protein